MLPQSRRPDDAANHPKALRGVLFRPRKGGWRAKISAGNRTIWLGSYRTDEEAALAYDAAARVAHGPEAVLNYPQEKAPVEIRAKVAKILVRAGLIEPSYSMLTDMPHALR